MDEPLPIAASEDDVDPDPVDSIDSVDSVDSVEPVDPVEAAIAATRARIWAAPPAPEPEPTPADELATGPKLLGARVRALREGMRLSLRDLAERSGVSAPMLSQVERGETSPTLQVAVKIAAGLNLRLSQLLRLDEENPVSVVRAHERRTGPGQVAGHAYQILTPPLPGQRFELSEHTLEPGAATGGAGDPPMHAAGSRETAVISRGSVTLVCDGSRVELEPGDAVTFDADLPHHFENRGAVPAAFHAVVSAGLRRA